MTELPQEDAPHEFRDMPTFMENLIFGADAPAPPVPDAEHPVMVVRSVRWSLDLDARLKAAAEARSVPVSHLVRDWIELELTALEHDQPISRSDALRALAAIRPLGGAA
jgi:predicted DNA-binding protein